MMLRWLFRVVLAMLAARLLARAAGQRHAPASRQKPQPAGDARAKSHARSPLSPYVIEDADYEDVPGSRR